MSVTQDVSGARHRPPAARGLISALKAPHRRLDDWVTRRHHPARNIEIRALLDTFFVCAVTTILVIRLQLWATHYPKLGGGKLHIAHLLWGGLGMLIAIVLLLSFLGAARRHGGAILGGIGFGFFIDEIGKFVTSDNDYFFKPAAGMIYIIFIVLFLVIRSLGWRHRWTPEECLANAMQLLSNATCQPVDERRRRMIRDLLSRSDQSDPLVPSLSAALERLEATPCPPASHFARASTRMRHFYERIVNEPWFPTALVTVFAVFAVAILAEVALDAKRIWEGHESAHVIAIAAMASSLIASGMIWVGIVSLRRSRLTAYRWFDYALLLQVFIAEVFAFLQHQFGAVFGLLASVTLLLTLRTMIHAECRSALLSDDPLDVSAGPGAGR
ncbi:MAG: hypothetical protein JOZ73_03180 [Solirubrobacterales bacterium]|nr:hypothetical protein [Solirubrobacterales bacterium]